MHLCVCVCMNEGALEYQELDLQAVVSHVLWALGTELGPLGEQQALLTTEQTLQHYCDFFS